MTDTEEQNTPKITKSDKNLNLDLYENHKNGELCTGKFAESFCMNEGTCYVIKSLEVYFCVCPGFKGPRCEEKQLEGTYGGGLLVRKSRSPRRSRPPRTPRMFHFVFSSLLCLVEVVLWL
jgi:hypothetical protein